MYDEDRPTKKERDLALIIRLIALSVALIVAIAVFAATVAHSSPGYAPVLTPLEDCEQATISGAKGEPTTQQVCERMVLVAGWLYPADDFLAVSCDPIVTRPIWRSHDCFITSDDLVSPKYELAVQRRKCARAGVRGQWRQAPMSHPTRCMKMWLSPTP